MSLKPATATETEREIVLKRTTMKTKQNKANLRSIDPQRYRS